VIVIAIIVMMIMITTIMLITRPIMTRTRYNKFTSTSLVVRLRPVPPPVLQRVEQSY